MRFRVIFYLYFILLFSASFFTKALAQLPLARMSSIFPMGCKAGEEVDVKVYGSDLEGATGLYFSRSGIYGELVNSTEHKFRVRAEANVPPGVYEVRFVGALGVSNPRPFVVSSLSEVACNGGNNSIETAYKINDQSVVNATVSSRQSHWFRLVCKPKQRILIRLSAESIDSRLSPIMYLRNQAGERLSRAGEDGVIDYVSNVSGDLFLEIHDSSFRGGSEYFFRVEYIVDGMHVDFVFPAVVSNLNESQVTLFGRNLPNSEPSLFKDINGNQLEQTVVKLRDLVESDFLGGLLMPPASINLEGGIYRLPGTPHNSNPFFLAHSNEELIFLEEDSDNLTDFSQKINSTGVVAGRFYPARDVDVFKFPVRKDQDYELDLFSQRLGFNTHPYVTTQIVGIADDGKETAGPIKEFYDSKDNPGGREFNMANRDVTWRFKSKLNGYLKVVLRDLFNQVSDDPFKSYLLSFRQQAPDFRLIVYPQTVPVDKNKRNIELMTTHLRKGSSLPFRIVAVRRGGFDGPINIVADKLPKGVSFQNRILKQGQNSITAFMVSSDVSEIFAGDIKFLGKAMIEGKEVEVEAVSVVTRHRIGDYNNEPVLARLTTGSVLSVNPNDPEPVMIAVGDKAVFKGVADGKVSIPLSIERHGDFSANFKLKAYGISQLDKLGELEIKKDQSKTSLEIDLSKFKVPIGSHKFHLESTVKGKYKYPPFDGNNNDKSKDVTYRLITSPIVLEILPKDKKQDGE